MIRSRSQPRNPHHPEPFPVGAGTKTRVFIPCPRRVAGPAFTSYAGNAGTFTFGYSNFMPPSVLTYFNGVIYNDSAVKIAGITDGTSNTFLFGEHSKGHLYILDPGYAVSDNSWNSGRWYDTLFATLYPLNLAIGNNTGGINFSYYYPTAAGSYHPGGANFGFCDGSVKFIKNSISSWTFQTGNADSYGDSMPDNTTFTTLGASTAPAPPRAAAISSTAGPTAPASSASISSSRPAPAAKSSAPTRTDAMRPSLLKNQPERFP